MYLFDLIDGDHRLFDVYSTNTSNSRSTQMLLEYTYGSVSTETFVYYILRYIEDYVQNVFGI
jgi:hypothetical protein